MVRYALAELILVDPSYATAIAAGWDHYLLLRPDGSVEAEGDNSAGQCNVPAGLTANAIAGGWRHSLALRPDGSVAAWGRNLEGQCNVPAGLRATAIAGARYASLALRPDGSVAQWGSLCATYIASGPPAGLTATAIDAGNNFAAALRPDGSVIVWGGSDVATFGPGSVKQGLTDAVAISCGTGFVTALRSDGSILWWTADNWSPDNTFYIPTTAIAIAAGQFALFAILPDFSIGFWEDPLNPEPTIIPGVKATAISTKDEYLVAIGRYVRSRRRRAAWMNLERPAIL